MGKYGVKLKSIFYSLYSCVTLDSVKNGSASVTVTLWLQLRNSLIRDVLVLNDHNVDTSYLTKTLYAQTFEANMLLHN